MLRRPTSAPETVRYASESPAGAEPSWCTRTFLVAQTAGHASVAEVAQEAVARARLIPEDVRFVTAKVVADYGVVPGFRRSAEERIRRDHDPARDRGGTRGDVARDLISRNLHVPRAKKRDPDPREIPVELCGSTRARIVLDRVAFHLELTYGLRCGRRIGSSFEEHASAVVVDRVSGEGAAVSVCDVDAPRAARDVVANDLHVRGFRAEDGDARITGAAYVVGDDLGAGRIEDKRADEGAVRDVVGEDLGLGGVCGEDPTVIACEGIVRDSSVAFSLKNGDPRLRVIREIVIPDSIVETCSKPNPGAAVAHDMVTFNSSVAGAENINHDRPEALVRLLLEAADRETRNTHVIDGPVDLAVREVSIAEDANSLRSKELRAGRVCFGSGGRFDNGVVSVQLYPVLADHHVLSVNSPDHDRVARMGSVYGILDRLARPNDRALRSGGADLGDGQGHPTCHQHRQSHGGKQHYGASHKESRLPSGGGVSSGVRRHSQRPFISNRRSILPYRGRRITQMSYLWCSLGVACG